jgi:hypothetical protein
MHVPNISTYMKAIVDRQNIHFKKNMYTKTSLFPMHTC